MSRKCVNSPNLFCHICGRFTTVEQRRKITSLTKKLYLSYFDCQLGDQDKSLAPHMVCKPCIEKLRKWSNRTLAKLPFGVPMVWREPTNHINDCYFCMTKIRGYNKKKKVNIKYPDKIPSALRPVSHSQNIPIPLPPSSQQMSDWQLDNEDETSSDSNNDEIQDEPYSNDTKETKLFSQAGLNDLVRDLKLSKKSAELLGSRLKERNMLCHDTKICLYRKREFQLTKEKNIVYCNNIHGLMEAMEIDYKVEEWRLFIDSSKTSLKAVLLHNGNILPSLPISHSIHLKETYGNLQNILNLLQYSTHNWAFCGDLKVISMILGLQGGNTKYPCFLCLWDSRARHNHYKVKLWPPRIGSDIGIHNIIEKPLTVRINSFANLTD